jgi:tetratricopeptide (TPR) repeat protein
MKFSIRAALIAGLVVATAGLPAYAFQAQPQQQQKPAQQQQQPGQQQQQQPGQQQKPSGQPAVETPGATTGPKVDPAEAKAYKAFYDLPAADPQKIISSGEAFLQQYPDSHYVGSVYSRLTSAYQSTGNDKKMFEVGRKALQANPDNVDVLSELAYTIPRRIDPNDLGSDQQLQEAAQYAKHAMELLAALTKPANMTDEAFAKAKNTELASCHSGLGLVYFYQHNIPQMVTELEQAVKLDPMPDPTDQFLLGFAYAQAGRWADAVTPLEACGANPGPIQQRCQTVLGEVKKHLPKK